MLQQPDPQGVQRYVGKSLVAADGEKIGTIEAFFYNKVTGVPTWIAVNTGFLGTKTLVVPVAGCGFEDSEVRSSYAKDVITDGPDVESGDSLSPEAESSLNSYFGLGADTASGSMHESP